jgi:hypothetical protein
MVATANSNSTLSPRLDRSPKLRSPRTWRPHWPGTWEPFVNGIPLPLGCNPLPSSNLPSAELLPLAVEGRCLACRDEAQAASGEVGPAAPKPNGEVGSPAVRTIEMTFYLLRCLTRAMSWVFSLRPCLRASLPPWSQQKTKGEEKTLARRSVRAKAVLARRSIRAKAANRNRRQLTRSLTPFPSSQLTFSNRNKNAFSIFGCKMQPIFADASNALLPSRFPRDFCGVWWTWGGSNPRPHRCERCALPTELHAHARVK